MYAGSCEVTERWWEEVAPLEFFILQRRKMAYQPTAKFFYLLVAIASVSSSIAEEACETLPSEIHIVKGKRKFCTLNKAEFSINSTPCLFLVKSFIN